MMQENVLNVKVKITKKHKRDKGSSGERKANQRNRLDGQTQGISSAWNVVIMKLTDK